MLSDRHQPRKTKARWSNNFGHQPQNSQSPNLAKDDWPVKYRAPFGALTKLREALPETYDEYKERKAREPTVASPHDAL